MKQLFTSLLFFFFIQFVWAQHVTEQKSPWIEGDQNSFAIEINSSADNVEGALKVRLTADGISYKNKKGFVACMAANWARVSSSTSDVYFKIKKTDNSHCVIYAFVSKGYNNFINSTTHADDANKIGVFLISMINETKKFELNNAITEANKNLNSATENLSELVKKQRKLEDKIVELKKELETNGNNQVKTNKEIEDVKSKIAELQLRLDSLK